MPSPWLTAARLNHPIPPRSRLNGTAGSPWSWERIPQILRVILKWHVGDHDLWFIYDDFMMNWWWFHDECMIILWHSKISTWVVWWCDMVRLCLNAGDSETEDSVWMAPWLDQASLSACWASTVGGFHLVPPSFGCDGSIRILKIERIKNMLVALAVASWDCWRLTSQDSWEMGLLETQKCSNYLLNLTHRLIRTSCLGLALTSQWVVKCQLLKGPFSRWPWFLMGQKG